MWSTLKIFYKIVFLYIPFILFGIIGIFLLNQQFGDLNSDTIKITNYGFAIVLSLSAVCFNWSRAITKDDDLQFFAKNQGEVLLMAAILFLIISGCKYVLITVEQNTITKVIPNFIKHLIQEVESIGFAASFTIIYWSLFRIFKRIINKGGFGPDYVSK